ncbi:DNA translocase FtsK [Marinobacterium sediminicola]|uniref:DNA translocase FtsK n=1 Tax=Marinobacterium sediminicola TaxID=518898 RepID=A0ABY1S2J7_9GAMM|nr:DNA translocase FtsK [Marinobacterium sediminicola]ULG70711.1 DNA translocase FtsK 4TM domain-containing protein [Marinobacterium sediminicola]SMR77275.1 DNA translocase FtsK [Marinobacterium sediminicola]
MSDKQPKTPPPLAEQLLSIVRESGLIILVGANLFLLLALIGYDPRDPGWSHLGYQPQVENFTGAAGAWLADGAISAVGVGAYLLPILLLMPAWRFLRRPQYGLIDSLPFLMLRTSGALLFLFSLCALASIHLSNEGLHYPFTVGGILGEALSDWSVSWFSLAGSSVLLWTLLLLGLTLFIEISWRDALEKLGAGILGLVDRLRERYTNVSADTVAETEPRWQEDHLERSSETIKFERSVREERQLPVLNDRVEPSFEQEFAEVEPESLADAPVTVEPVQKENSSVEESFSDVRSETVVQPVVSKVEEVLAKKSLKIVPLSQTHTPLAEEADQEPAQKRKQLPRLPSLDLLDPPSLQQQQGYSEDDLERMSRLLETKLNDFGVKAEVVEVNPGPVITRFELQPAPGVKASKISNLSRDLARSMAVTSVRVVEVIPGKSVVGVEIPNEVRQTVQLSEVLNAKPYLEASSRLTLALGNDIAGNPVVANLAKMPHLLVAGTTGSGKSVGVNAMLLSLLLKATPDEVRLILVDPKMLELSIYEGIPHLLTPVITDMKEAAGGLRWCVAEMERRYRLMAKMGVRNIAGFNDKVISAQEAGQPIPDPLWNPQEYGYPEDEPAPALETLPYIVVVIDEFADMMMMVGKKVEELIARIAQKARAAGIHLILATQRPSVDVITGLIKANIPTRIAFQVSSKIDSRTILDQGGAESLLGYGDMLYVPAGTSIPNRVHGAFVSDDEVHRVVEQWKLLGTPNYIDVNLSDGGGEASSAGAGFDDEQDPLYDEAVAFVTESRKASISSVQRKLKIGYNRAARMIESMEAAGVVSEAGSNGQREVLAPPPPRD